MQQQQQHAPGWPGTQSPSTPMPSASFDANAEVLPALPQQHGALQPRALRPHPAEPPATCTGDGVKVSLGGTSALQPLQPPQSYHQRQQLLTINHNATVHAPANRSEAGVQHLVASPQQASTPVNDQGASHVERLLSPSKARCVNIVLSSAADTSAAQSATASQPVTVVVPRAKPAALTAGLTTTSVGQLDSDAVNRERWAAAGTTAATTAAVASSSDDAATPLRFQQVLLSEVAKSQPQAAQFASTTPPPEATAHTVAVTLPQTALADNQSDGIQQPSSKPTQQVPSPLVAADMPVEQLPQGVPSAAATPDSEHLHGQEVVLPPSQPQVQRTAAQMVAFLDPAAHQGLAPDGISSDQRYLILPVAVDAERCGRSRAIMILPRTKPLAARIYKDAGNDRQSTSSAAEQLLVLDVRITYSNRYLIPPLLLN